MAKAKDDHTLPLDDPRWLLLKAAIDERTQHTGDLGLAILDLKRDMASDRLRSMRRNRDTGEARLESVSFWETYSVGYIGSSSVTICRQSDLDRHELDEYGNLVAECLDDLFYVWRPDLDRLRPVQQSTPARRREARKNAGGRPPKIAPHQQQQLQEKYHSDMAAEPRLAKHDAAVLHVKALAKSEFGIEVGTNTLLEQIIRPALQKTRNNQ